MVLSEDEQKKRQRNAWKKRDNICVGDKFVWHFKEFGSADGRTYVYGTSGKLPKKYMLASDRWGLGRVVMEICRVYHGENGYGPFVDYWMVPEGRVDDWYGEPIDCMIINGHDAFKMMRKNTKTRFKDRNGYVICLGDVLWVQQYPGKWVGGSYEYEGVVEERGGKVYVTYYDIGEEESLPLSMFPRQGRELLTEEERKAYWRTALLGGEPSEGMWKRMLYAGVRDDIKS